MANDKKHGRKGDGSTTIALTIMEAASLSRTSRSTIYEALQRRELEGKKLGRRTIILRDALEDYLSSLPSFSGGRVDGGSAK